MLREIDEVFDLGPDRETEWRIQIDLRIELDYGIRSPCQRRRALLDEPSFGLAPMLVQEIFHILRRISEEDGVGMLLVEQNASLALSLAQEAFLLETGRVAMSGPAALIGGDEQIRRVYLGY